jgi:hypothetical protein
VFGFLLTARYFGTDKGKIMPQSKISIIPLAAALASLGTPGNAAISVKTDVAQPTDSVKAEGEKPQANVFYQIGHDLMGLIVTEREDGTLFAGHTSHSSHSSHHSSR